MLLSPSFCRTRDWPSGVMASLPAARMTAFNSVFVARLFDIVHTFHAPASNYDAGQLLHRKCRETTSHAQASTACPTTACDGALGIGTQRDRISAGIAEINTQTKKRW